MHAFERFNRIGKEGKAVKSVFSVPSSRGFGDTFVVYAVTLEELAKMVGAVGMNGQRLLDQGIEVNRLRWSGVFKSEGKCLAQADEPRAGIVAQHIVQIEENNPRWGFDRPQGRLRLLHGGRLGMPALNVKRPVV
jgi:hypothetical protein